MSGRTRFFVAAVLGMLVAGPVSAQDDDEYPIDPTLVGIYVGGSLGASVDNFKDSGDFAPPLLTSLILGYRGSEYISLESEFEWLGVGSTSSGDFEGWLASLGFRVHIPLGRIEPYLTYSGGVLNVRGSGGSSGSGGRVDSTDFAITGGGGVAFQLDDNVSLFAEGLYTWPISGVQGYDYGSVRFGVLYKFSEDE